LIKLAPVMMEMSRRRVPHRIIFTGQHGRQTQALLDHFRLRKPDRTLYNGEGVFSAPHALRWIGRIICKAALDRLRHDWEIFAPGPGVCVVHGDTLSTLLAVVLAGMLGLRVAHIESGLRSYNWRHPFPEEIIRVIANRRADLLFAPGQWARDNLLKMKVTGRIVTLAANTGKDALDYVLCLPSTGAETPPTGPFALASIHRFETVNRPQTLARAVDVVRRAAGSVKVIWPLHTVTRRALGAANLLDALAAANVELREILPYPQFARLLGKADFVITDGGSIQEESFFLDKPCLLLRRTTERREGLGENVVLSRWDDGEIDAFLADPRRHVRRTDIPAEGASPVIVDELLSMHSRLSQRRTLE